MIFKFPIEYSVWKRYPYVLRNYDITPLITCFRVIEDKYTIIIGLDVVWHFIHEIRISREACEKSNGDLIDVAIADIQEAIEGELSKIIKTPAQRKKYMELEEKIRAMRL